MTAPRGTSSGCFVPWQPWGVGIGTGLFGHKMDRALAHSYFVPVSLAGRRHGIGEGVADKVRAACSSSRGIPHSVPSTLDGGRRRNHEAVLGMLSNGALDKMSRRELHIVRVFGNRRLEVGASLVPSSSLQQLPFPKLYRDVDLRTTTIVDSLPPSTSSTEFTQHPCEDVQVVGACFTSCITSQPRRGEVFWKPTACALGYRNAATTSTP